MPIDTFANRLQKALDKRNMKPIELSEKTGIDKSLISNYLSGNYKAKQDKLTIISEVLDVNPVWLMGYDVSMQEIKENNNQNDLLNQYQSLFDKDDRLTDEQKKFFMDFLTEKHKEFDEKMNK